MPNGSAPNTTRKVPKFLQKAYAAVRKNLAYGNVTANNLKAMKNERNAAYAAEQAANAAAKAAAAANTAVKEINAVVKTEKNCGKKPMAWVGTSRNPAFTKWQECMGMTRKAGGKRRTHKKRSMRRRR